MTPYNVQVVKSVHLYDLSAW